MLKKITAGKFADETSIIPDMVAERIVAEAAALIRKHSLRAHSDVCFYDTLQPNTGIFRDQEEPVSFLVDHALSTYSNNKRFKRQVRGTFHEATWMGLGYLESYMRHWLSAEIIRRNHSPLVRAWLVEITKFANGEPFNG